MSIQLFDRERAVLRTLRDEPFVVLDVETTGLEGDVIEAAVINHQGDVVFNHRFYTDETVHPKATDVHGISNEDLTHEPRWLDDPYPELNRPCSYAIKLLSTLISVHGPKHVVTYSDGFDQVRLYETLKKHDVWTAERFNRLTFHHIIQMVADVFGSTATWNDRHESYTYLKLTAAAEAAGVPFPKTLQHVAYGDALVTYSILQRLIGALD